VHDGAEARARPPLAAELQETARRNPAEAGVLQILRRFASAQVRAPAWRLPVYAVAS
jgi:hypothetical protein